MRYASRAKREADVSLSHRCTMEHPVAPWSTTMRRVFHPETNGVKASPHRHKRVLSHGKRRKASSVTRHGRHRTSPALHVTRKTRSRRLAVAPLHHGAPRCDRSYHPATNAWKLVRTGINGCSAMAHPLTHLTHGISTRRRFHPAKTGETVPEERRQVLPSRPGPVPRSR